jgi:hypothetical protein
VARGGKRGGSREETSQKVFEMTESFGAKTTRHVTNSRALNLILLHGIFYIISLIY